MQTPLLQKTAVQSHIWCRNTQNSQYYKPDSSVISSPWQPADSTTHLPQGRHRWRLICDKWRNGVCVRVCVCVMYRCGCFFLYALVGVWSCCHWQCARHMCVFVHAACECLCHSCGWRHVSGQMDVTVSWTSQRASGCLSSLSSSATLVHPALKFPVREHLFAACCCLKCHSKEHWHKKGPEVENSSSAQKKLNGLNIKVALIKFSSPFWPLSAHCFALTVLFWFSLSALKGMWTLDLINQKPESAFLHLM